MVNPRPTEYKDSPKRGGYTNTRTAPGGGAIQILGQPQVGGLYKYQWPQVGGRYKYQWPQVGGRSMC